MKRFKLFLLVIVFGGIVCVIVFNSNCYYSNKLVHAIESEDIELVECILEEKPDCVNTYPSIFPKAILYGVFDAGRINYPLIEACCSDNLEIVKLLVDSGADVNCNDGRTPLSVTYGGKQENWYQISQFLIEKGASLDYVTEYSGEYSSILGDIIYPRTGASLPDYIPESNKEVFAAFCYAVENCNHDKINWGHVLQEAVSFNRVEIVHFLLDNEYCDANEVSYEMSALMFAARDSTPEMVQLLLEYGADIDYMTSEGQTAYDFAVQSGNKEILEVLER